MLLKGCRNELYSTPTKKKLTRDDRMRIITLRDEAKYSWGEIVKATRHKKSTCRMVYYRSKANGTPSTKRRSGRPEFLTPELLKQLEEFVTRDKHTCRLSWEEIILELDWKISVDVVKKRMKRLGYHKRIPRK
ncbi:MAG: hypothetical protein M1829_002115, partial [Trizodia sp. TS-e1964]